MSNNRSLIGSPIFSDVGVTYTPVLSGGSWSLPLSNLQDGELAKVARSTNDDLTSTIIKYDLGVARAIRLGALVSHNISSAGKWRHRVLAAEPVFDSSDLGTFTDFGTPNKTSGQTDPFGGTRAYLITDNDAGASEGVASPNISFTGDGVKVIAVTVRESSGAFRFRLQDTSAVATRHQAAVSFAGGVPSMATEAGAGTLYSVQALGNGNYVLIVGVDGVVAANDNRIEILLGANAGQSAALYVYEFMAWDYASGNPVLHDTGVDDCWPSGIDAEEYEGYVKTLLDPLTAAVTGRYGRIEIADTSNADGYVEAGRLAICGAWEPTYAMDVGHRLGWAGSSTSEETDGGAEIHNERRQRRIADVSFGDISHDEALANAFDMQARLGTTKQLFVVLDPDDSTNMHRLSFLGRMRQLSLLEAAHYHRRNIPLAFVEVL